MTKPRKETRVALIDLDNTICDYEGAMRESLRKIRGPEEPNVTPGHADDAPAHIQERMRLIKSNPKWWASLPVLSSGDDILGLLTRIGFRIVVLTQGPAHRTENDEYNEAAWLGKFQFHKKHFPINTDLCITRDKSLSYGRVMVDDWPEYALGWLEYRPRGLVIMPAMPYNAHIDHPNIIRYDGKNGKEVERRAIHAYNRKNGEELAP